MGNGGRVVNTVGIVKLGVENMNGVEVAVDVEVAGKVAPGCNVLSW